MVTSRTLETFCADIENLLREGALRSAVRLSVALPDICVALGDSALKSSAQHYAQWCDTWCTWKEPMPAKSLNGARVYRFYSGAGRPRRVPGPPDDLTQSSLARFRVARRARRSRSLARSRIWYPMNRFQAFQVELTEALVEGARKWYREQGASNATVQRNLGRLLISG